MNSPCPVKAPNSVAYPELLTRKSKTQPVSSGGPKSEGICPETVPLNGTWSPAAAGMGAEINTAAQSSRSRTRYFPQRAHDRDAEERQRRQGRTDDHVLRFVTSVGAE